jgi:hypothetical protein
MRAIVMLLVAMSSGACVERALPLDEEPAGVHRCTGAQDCPEGQQCVSEDITCAEPKCQPPGLIGAATNCVSDGFCAPCGH